MRQNIVGLVFAFGVGLLLAWLAYTRVTDPEPQLQRAREEAAVHAAAAVLAELLGAGNEVELIDPLHPNRAVGKTYVYPAAGGWQVSGYYRRGESDSWHPWLMTLDGQRRLVSVSVQDDAPEIRVLAESDPRVSTTP
ncbi:MAG: hypothetical protein OEY08_18615 [Gammaproteobacteria bacterium]|nr:hypothetical protein [Gammaproteobacteria bacterium]